LSLFRSSAGSERGEAAGVAAGPDKLPAAGGDPLTPLDRTYFAFVGGFALWVGVWGFFLPGAVDKALPWMVPPLHARVIGAFYLSGLVLMAACLLRRDRRQVGVGLRIAVVWTGILLLASLLHLGEFDPANPRVWFWFFAYILFPPWGAWLIWRGRDAEPLAAPPAPPWMVAGFLVQGVACCLLALLLFLAPGVMVGLWPWKVTVLLAEIYAGPFLSYGIGSLLLTRRRHAAEIGTTAAAMATFVVLVIVASLIHRDLLPPENPAVIVWYAGLAASAALLSLVLADRLRVWRRGA
jgi:hypothetical protein